MNALITYRDAMAGQSGHDNRLKEESSPYLLQHADNPVNWYPWSDEAFAKARREDKPVLLSIGYSTCHWCHVMAHESFEDPGTAALMNEHFVSIKVDREERPDIDGVYMSAVMAMTGSGGWPLTVFLTPDGRPFYGGTYFPPEPKWGTPGFKQLLRTLADAWQNRRDQVLRSSEQLTAMLKGEDAPLKNVPMGRETLHKAYRQFEQSFDEQDGGFGHAPKFPSAHNLRFLLRFWKRENNPQALHMVTKTLSAICRGGIYDHLGGGFHRYATDARWHVPHFEKMLYDQAMMTHVLLDAYQATGNGQFAQVVRKTLDYVLRVMTDPQGGFYSAEDADSLPPGDTSGPKKEGAFYVWTLEEIQSLLDEQQAEVIGYYFGLEPGGNAFHDPHGEFSGRNILFVAHSVDETAKHFRLKPDEAEKIIRQGMTTLWQARQKRPRPHLDDKVLTDWNGLMLGGFARAGRILQESRYLAAAQKAADFFWQTMRRGNGRLWHRYRQGQAGIEGHLDDYAFLINGLLWLYESTFDPEYLERAIALARVADVQFWDEDNGGYYFTPKDTHELFVRRKDVYDGALPSGNSIAALNLQRLGHITLDEAWTEKSQRLFTAFSAEIDRMPYVYSAMLTAFDMYLGPVREVVIAAVQEDKSAGEMLDAVYKRYLPNTVVVMRTDANKEQLIPLVPFVEKQVPVQEKTTGYVCENHQCQLPTSNLFEFTRLLDQSREATGP